jgi:hypothetical protein
MKYPYPYPWGTGIELNPWPYPCKPIPAFTGRGMCRYRYGYGKKYPWVTRVDHYVLYLVITHLGVCISVGEVWFGLV